MKIQRFTAASMAEALSAVRQALGSEAVILEAEAGRRAKQGGGVTVLAVADRHAPGGSPAASPPTAPSPPVAAASRLRASAPMAPSAGPGEEAARLRQRLAHLGRLVTSDHFSRIPIPLRELYLDMVAADVDSNLAFSLLEELAERGPVSLMDAPDLTPLRRRLCDLLAEAPRPPATSPGERLLLVGPPGAGKTTLAAALATRVRQRGLTPGLISLDTFRAAGGRVLAHYAGVLGVPYATIASPEELAAGEPAWREACEILILDAPGLLPDDAEVLGELTQCCNLLPGLAVHGVLPATGKARDLVSMLDALSGLRPQSLSFTRLDETSSYGGILSLSLKARLPVAYFQWGREVAGKLEPATPERTVELVLGAAGAPRVEMQR